MTHEHPYGTTRSVAGDAPRLPTVSTRDLNGVERTLPDGRLDILVLAYERWQQHEVDTWVPALEALEQAVADLRYYELPVVGDMGALGRRSLDFWMRRGIPDPEVRARTLTFYTDPASFREPLGIEDGRHIAVVLIGADGLVLWRGLGPCSRAAEVSLRAAVAAAAERPLA